MSDTLVAGSGDRFLVKCVDAQYNLETDEWADVPIDLTPYTSVVFRYRINDGGLKTLALVKDPDQVGNRGYASAPFGSTDLDWTSGDLEQGVLRGEVEIKQGASTPIILPDPIILNVRRKI